MNEEHDERDEPDRRAARSDANETPVTARPTHAPPHSALSSVTAHSVSVGALSCWLLIQLVVLAMSAARVPLWYRAPDPVERVAVEQMLAAQVIASALLFPWLLRNAATSACVMLVSAPFVQLAAMLTEIDASRAALAWAYVAGWIVTLSCWSCALHSRRARLAGVAIASSLAIGVPVVRYLRAEFHHFPPPGGGWRRFVDPVASAISQLEPSTSDAASWVTLVALAVIGVTACWWLAARGEVTSYPQR